MALSDESKACSRPYGRAIAAVALGLAMTVGGAWALGPTIGNAHADSKETLAQLRQEVSAKSQAYNEAMEATAQAQADVEDCRARIADIESRIPGAQEKAATAMVTQYKFSQNSAGLLNVILSSDGFENFVATLTYLNTVQTYTSGQLEGLLELQDELEQEQANLEGLLAEAQQAEDEAAEALAQVQAAADEAEARVAEEEAARQAALAAQAAAAASRDQSTVTTETDSSTGETIFIETKPDGTTERVDEDRANEIINSNQNANQGSSESGGSTPEPEPDPEPSEPGGSTGDSTVDSWAARIDAYLAGSTLSGYGRVFAQAALAYGVDPRWSPAISCIESTMGAYCFRPYNAWGWMGHSFSSWEEAIWAHVEYLGYMYGGKLTMDAANIYCDPGEEWYYAVLGEMESI